MENLKQLFKIVDGLGFTYYVTAEDAFDALVKHKAFVEEGIKEIEGLLKGTTRVINNEAVEVAKQVLMVEAVTGVVPNSILIQ